MIWFHVVVIVCLGLAAYSFIFLNHFLIFLYFFVLTVFFLLFYSGQFNGLLWPFWQPEINMMLINSLIFIHFQGLRLSPESRYDGDVNLSFTYLSINLSTKKQLKQYIISCKTVADALKITVLNAKTSSASWGFAPDPPPGALLLEPPLEALPPDPHYRLALPRSPWVCVVLKKP